MRIKLDQAFDMIVIRGNNAEDLFRSALPGGITAADKLQRLLLINGLIENRSQLRDVLF